MNNEQIIQLIKAIGNATSNLWWPALVAFLIFYLRDPLGKLINRGEEFFFKFRNSEVKLTAPKQIINLGDKESAKQTIDDEKVIPVDYLFLNHASFFREEKQAEFKKRTKINSPHYDIRIVVDSYYKGALKRIEKVRYIMHESYPVNEYIIKNRESKFLLKELAYGESVIVAEVFLKDREKPIILTRYLTLSEIGPKI